AVAEVCTGCSGGRVARVDWARRRRVRGWWMGSLMGLTPPVRQRVYKMGLEHRGVVIGDEVDAFSRKHRATLTGQQFQSADNEPYYVLFEDFTHVKFYRRSLYDVCVLQGATFDGFVHVDDWAPHRLLTATGPQPLP